MFTGGAGERLVNVKGLAHGDHSFDCFIRNTRVAMRDFRN
ncbi:hypothetical protein Z947_3124 [Sulfitobacter geojensis]|nr:hypothetical protein Z947_3124 [Sulfitobacter geojensis]